MRPASSTLAAMKLYADRPARLARQVAGDVLLVVLIWLFVRAGRATHEHVDALAGPGRDAEAAGVRFSEQHAHGGRQRWAEYRSSATR